MAWLLMNNLWVSVVYLCSLLWRRLIYNTLKGKKVHFWTRNWWWWVAFWASLWEKFDIGNFCCLKTLSSQTETVSLHFKEVRNLFWELWWNIEVLKVRLHQAPTCVLKSSSRLQFGGFCGGKTSYRKPV